MNEFKLVEWFWTFQGEGSNWGRRAFFIRLPFCNLACSWCDTQFNTFVKVTRDDLQNDLLSEPSRFAVLTGGEPSMNSQLPHLISFLKESGFEIAIESNGMFQIPASIDFITVSPKRDSDYEVHPDNFDKISELKLVVDEGFDFEVCKRFEHLTCRLTLSPEFGRFEDSVKDIEQFIQRNPKWRISLQTHKFMHMR